jgi:DNA polymerase Ligase (LigD)
MAAPMTGRFVVLEHEWNGIHWDFMLEAGDGLKTWSLGAPIVPGLRLEASMLPDHRRIYLTFEGPIAGGRGRVRRVAEGAYQTIEWTPEHIRVLLIGTQLVGEAELYRSPCGDDSDGGSTTWTFLLGKVS